MLNGQPSSSVMTNIGPEDNDLLSVAGGIKVPFMGSFCLYGLQHCQLGCTSTGLVEDVDISTLPKQQPYNSNMPTSRRGMQ